MSKDKSTPQPESEKFDRWTAFCRDRGFPGRGFFVLRRCKKAFDQVNCAACERYPACTAARHIRPGILGQRPRPADPEARFKTSGDRVF